MTTDKPLSSRLIEQAAILARWQHDDDTYQLSKAMRLVSENLKKMADEDAVKAVDCHDELVAALESIRGKQITTKDGEGKPYIHFVSPGKAECIEIACAALAKVAA